MREGAHTHTERERRMKWAGTHNGVSRAPLMGFKAHLADDMTNPGNVMTL